MTDRELIAELARLLRAGLSPRDHNHWVTMYAYDTAACGQRCREIRAALRLADERAATPDAPSLAAADTLEFVAWVDARDRASSAEMTASAEART